METSGRTATSRCDPQRRSIVCRARADFAADVDAVTTDLATLRALMEQR